MSFAADLAKFPSATSVTVNSEGGSATTNLQQGLAKAWCHYHQIGTPAIKQSANISSIADVATGLVTHSFTNNFSYIDYAWSGVCCNQSSGITPAGAATQMGGLFVSGSYPLTTSTISLYSLVNTNTTGGGAGTDFSMDIFNIHGDLA